MRMCEETKNILQGCTKIKAAMPEESCGQCCGHGCVCVCMSVWMLGGIGSGVQVSDRADHVATGHPNARIADDGRKLSGMRTLETGGRQFD